MSIEPCGLTFLSASAVASRNGGADAVISFTAERVPPETQTAAFTSSPFLGFRALAAEARPPAENPQTPMLSGSTP